ncbi:hypothetical protein GGE65_005339 [Skermanella aerolata]|uniref:DUF4258 domain-containing protein n=1 Tax=Skermanella aerolata TaxID=393310 RepID=UPI003D1E4B19
MYEKEAQLIRSMMASGARIIYSIHAEMDRMPERNITYEDVKAVLSACVVTGIRQNKLGPVWAAEGTDLDDRFLRIPVAVKELRGTIIVVSAIEL